MPHTKSLSRLFLLKLNTCLSTMKFVCDNLVTSLFRFIVSVRYDVGLHQLKLMSELMEVHNEEIVKQLSEQLSSHEFVIEPGFYQTTTTKTAERESLINFVRRFVTKANELDVNFRDKWSENEMKKILDAIKSSNNKKVCFICI